MRKNVLPITAGVLASLVLAVSASADFTGFTVEAKGNPYDTDTAFLGGSPPNFGMVQSWNVYANFNDENDSLNSIFVLAAEQMSMRHSSDLVEKFDGAGSGYWNWTLGTNAPLAVDGAYAADSAAGDADTYLSIGLKSGSFVTGQDAAFFAPGTEAVLVASGIMGGNGIITDDFGYNATPDDSQTFPLDGRVLVFNFSIKVGEHASGSWNLQWGNTSGGGGQAVAAEWTTIPSPGALALLGLAGLAGTRRRRRG